MDASEARANSVEDEVFLATLLTDIDDDAMQVDAQVDAETSK
jgi:bifunctional DNase/RNase